MEMSNSEETKAIEKALVENCEHTNSAYVSENGIVFVCLSCRHAIKLSKKQELIIRKGLDRIRGEVKMEIERNWEYSKE